MLTYDDIEQLHRDKRYEPGTKEFHAVEDFINFRRRYQRGLTDPIYGLQAMDELRVKVEQIISPTPLSLADDLAALQSRIHAIREDYHDNAELDKRLNGVEAEIGEMVSKTKGEQ